jgi:hypothetical protein
MALPGMKTAGLVSHASIVCAVQVIPEPFNAAEYRRKLDTLPALRPITPAKLGPAMLRPGSSEWHPAQARNTSAPLAMLPTDDTWPAANAGQAPAVIPSKTIASAPMSFLHTGQTQSQGAGATG